MALPRRMQHTRCVCGDAAGHCPKADSGRLQSCLLPLAVSAICVLKSNLTFQFSSWCSWGYFNRRMWLRRQLGLDERLEQADVLPDPQRPMVEETSYGDGFPLSPQRMLHCQHTSIWAATWALTCKWPTEGTTHFRRQDQRGLAVF